MHKGHCIIFNEDKTNITVSNSIEEIKPEDWNRFFNHGDPFLSYAYFRSLEEDPSLRMYYAEIRKDGVLKGLAYFQVVNIEGHKLSKAFSAGGSQKSLGMSFARLAKAVNCKFMYREWDLLIGGNALNPSKEGFAFEDLGNKEVTRYMKRILEEVISEAKKEGANIKATLVPGVMDDWSDEILSGLSFRDIEIEPEMILVGLDGWNTFEDYLEAMSSKYRVRTKKVYKNSAALEEQLLTLEDIEHHRNALMTLYHNVVNKAQLCLHKVDPDYFSRLKKSLGDTFQLKVYKEDGQIVGFISWFVSEGELHAHLIGLDYNVNKNRSLYQRILYDLVAEGIKAHCSRVIFGRTAPEMKSTIGAQPISSSAYFKTTNPISNAALRPLRKLVNQPEWVIRRPFKINPGEVS